MVSRIFFFAGVSLALLVPVWADAQKQPSSEVAARARELEFYYARRAYPGAPPAYVHALGSDVDLELDACLGCHEQGTADGPVTPHPGLPECRQCHVRAKSDTMFRPTDWARPLPPGRGPVALPGAPPTIPHALTLLASDCMACHGKSATLRAIRTPHPERASCQQCHVQRLTRRTWSRK